MPGTPVRSDSIDPVRPDSIDAVRHAVRQSALVLPVGAATKPTLSIAAATVQRIDMRRMTGIVEYEPTEFTITALAGTPVAQLQRTLAQHGQYLPFDPPLVEQGSTIGGAIAAGISGPCRLAHGGVRDFVLGVRLVDGLGALVTGGGKVVKNAAGFDFPKLMVGSCGRMGVIVEVTLKVLPRPDACCTVAFALDDLTQAIALQNRLCATSLPIAAVDMQPPGSLWVRLAARRTALRQAAERVLRMGDHRGVLLTDDDPAEPDVWRPLRDWSWPGDDRPLVRVALPPRQLPALDAALHAHDARRRYSVAGNVAWIGWPAERPIDQLSGLLRQQQLAGTVLRGRCRSPWIGTRTAAAFARRIQRALDPDGRFLAWETASDDESRT